MQKIVIVLSLLVLASCAPATQPVSYAPATQPVVVDVSPIKTAEVTIVQDKTTKHELLSALGAPTDLYNAYMTWRESANPREYFVVRYIQNDGTTFDFCVGQIKTCKSYFSVSYKVDKEGNSIDIVKSVRY